jgi:hypothetical protein
VDANDALNAWLQNQYPDGHPASESDESVPSVSETSGADQPRDVLESGGSINPSVDISGADSAIAAICIGFGDPGNAWCIPTSNTDVSLSDTTGDGNPDQASLALAIPPALCDGLSKICHDIRCYEFAQTDSGTFTAGDVAYLAAACGKCDEPSCQELIPEGECADYDCAEVDDLDWYTASQFTGWEEMVSTDPVDTYNEACQAVGLAECDGEGTYTSPNGQVWDAEEVCAQIRLEWETYGWGGSASDCPFC